MDPDIECVKHEDDLNGRSSINTRSKPARIMGNLPRYICIHIPHRRMDGLYNEALFKTQKQIDILFQHSYESLYFPKMIYDGGGKISRTEWDLDYISLLLWGDLFIYVLKNRYKTVADRLARCDKFAQEMTKSWEKEGLPIPVFNIKSGKGKLEDASTYDYVCYILTTESEGFNLGKYEEVNPTIRSIWYLRISKYKEYLMDPIDKEDKAHKYVLFTPYPNNK